MSDFASAASAVEQRLGHVFADRALLVAALTHPSYLNEHPTAGPHNQRLEFLGDAVLQLVLTETLFARYPDAAEGELSRRRTVLANGRCLASLAADLGVSQALRLGGSENTPEGRARPSNLEDAFEALVGALLLDAGLPVARDRVLALYGPLETRLAVGLAESNPKGRLQERLQPIHGTASVRYETERGAGPDHAKEYIARVYVGDRPEALGEGRGQSKKTAEEAAARAALAKLPDEA